MKELDRLLKILNEVDPITPKEKETRIERISRKGYKYILAITASLFVALLILAAWHRMSTLPESLNVIAQWIAFSAIVLPILYISFDLAVGLWAIFNFKSRSFDWLILEISHDKKAIETLVEYKKSTLIEAQEWLELKCARMKSRISTFIGNSDKYAVFSLIGLGWSVWKEISKTSSTHPFSLTNGDIVQTLLLYGTAFLTGIALGAMIVNYQVQRYTYQLELIEFALKQKNKIL